jgi:lipopolysaccharide/colanic/teichoic acid biosynthesis glycosyltransferase
MIKRILDLSLSIALIVLCFPLILLVLFFVFYLTGDNPIFMQERKLSLDKKGFKIIKIRTIKNTKDFLELERMSDDIFVKRGYEEYIHAFCRWLRKTGVDEILQIINVLKNEMSFVGPRPLLEKDLLIIKKANPEIYNRRRNINSKPGITGYWQVFGERSKGVENLTDLDDQYEKEKSFLFDTKIIFKTIFILTTAGHSDSIIPEKNKKLVCKTKRLSLPYLKQFERLNLQAEN